jgi:hypothetical protein
MTNQIIHEHQLDRWITRTFSACVAPDTCNPAAHGGMTDIILCRCGAMQKINIRLGYREQGDWQGMIVAEEV